MIGATTSVLLIAACKLAVHLYPGRRYGYLLTALIARELGGRRFAQVLAAITTLAAPGILGSDNIFTMNAFEPLFWMGQRAK